MTKWQPPAAALFRHNTAAHAPPLPHDQHRPAGGAHQRFGDAAEHRAPHAAASVRAHHDQVRVAFRGRSRQHGRHILAARVDRVRGAAHAAQPKRGLRVRHRDRGLVRIQPRRVALVDIAAVDVRQSRRVRYLAHGDDQAARIAGERDRLVEREPRAPRLPSSAAKIRAYIAPPCRCPASTGLPNQSGPGRRDPVDAGQVKRQRQSASIPIGECRRPAHNFGASTNRTPCRSRPNDDGHRPVIGVGNHRTIERAGPRR